MFQKCRKYFKSCRKSNIYIVGDSLRHYKNKYISYQNIYIQKTLKLYLHISKFVYFMENFQNCSELKYLNKHCGNILFFLSINKIILHKSCMNEIFGNILSKIIKYIYKIPCSVRFFSFSPQKVGLLHIYNRRKIFVACYNLTK